MIWGRRWKEQMNTRNCDKANRNTHRAERLSPGSLSGKISRKKSERVYVAVFINIESPDQQI